MRKTWQLHEAKNKLTEVIEKALSEGPQTITRRGVETAVVVSVKEFKKFTGAKGSLADFFARSPLKGVAIDLRRDRDTGRDPDLEVSD